jgi:hypothetical protein
MKTTLTITRAGSFRIKSLGDNHCGALPSGDMLTIKYEFVCVCDTSLDSRGFLFDQVEIDKYFRGRKWTSLSCEHLCMSIANRLIKRILKENPKCRIKRGSLTLSPEPFAASMKYGFRN